MRRPLRLFFRALVVALLVLAALLGAAYWFLQRDPGGLVNRYLGEAAREHGLAFSMGAVDVDLLPSPALSVSNVRVEGDGLALSAAFLTVRPDLIALVRGRFSPWSLTLVRPRLEARLDEPLSPPGEAAARLRALLDKPREGADDAPLGFLEGSCRLEITQGECRLTGADGASLALRGLQCRLKAAPAGEMEGSLQFASLRYATKEATLASLERFSLKGESDLARPLNATPGLKLAATLHARDWPGAVRLSLGFLGQPGGWNGSFEIASDLGLGGPTGEIVPLRVDGTAAMAHGGRVIQLRGVTFALGPDSGRLDGNLRLPDASRGPELAGSLLLHRASLTQWLGFARNLAPGLQLALDNITEASVDFQLDDKGLKAQRISAVCAGSRFTGSGGVPSWAAPEVVLDLKSPSVNLGLALPEAVARPPESAYYPHPTLTPMPGEPLQPGETGINYDIRLAADMVRYGPVTLTAAKTRIYPGKLDKNGLEDVLIDAEAAFYGGTFRGQCILGGSKATPYAITAQARGINGAPLARAMPVLPFASGRFRADVSVQSQGRALDEFLSHLRGKLSVRGEQGSLAGGLAGGKLAFSRLDADIALRSGVWRGARLGLDGGWKLRLDNADMEATADLDGRLWFGATDAGAGMEFQKVPASGTLRLGAGLSGLGQGLNAAWRAVLGCQSARKRVTLSGLHIEALAATVSGELTLEGATPSVQGRIEAKSPDLAKSLQRMGVAKPRLPQGVRSLTLAAELAARPESVALRKLNARAGPIAATGSLTLSRREGRPFVEFALASEALDVEKLTDTGQSAKTKPRGGVWEVPFMREFDARGELRVRDLSGWRFHIRDLSLPLALAAGRLTVGPGKGRFYGATLHTRGTVDFRKALGFDSSLSVTAFDLAVAARDRKLESALDGQATLSAALNARDLGPGRLPAALNGKWSFSVRNGSYQERTKSGELKGEPTRFSVASASGTVTNGVAQSKDLRIQGPTLTTTGSGSLNLVNRTIDCNFTVNMKGLPEFPLRVYGNVEKPKTSIGAGKLILNTITGITSGFVDILGGIVEGTWKIFR